jgi:hypothetical protein
MLGVGYSYHGRMVNDPWLNGDLFGVSLSRNIVIVNKDDGTSSMHMESMVSLQWQKL